MDDVSLQPWIHIGDCPVCVNGLCRVRICQGDGCGAPHLYAMCDECEATFLEPSIDESRLFPAVEDPNCPLCEQPLYGPQSNWAKPADVEGTDWSSQVILVWPTL